MRPDEANLKALESRRGEHPLLDEHIEWAMTQQMAKRNANVVEVQLPKKLRLVRVVEKDYRATPDSFTGCE